MKKQNNSESSAFVSADVYETPKFTVEQLRKDAFKLFGVSQSTYAGATYNLDGKYTVKEMKDHIDKWLKKEVK